MATMIAANGSIFAALKSSRSALSRIADYTLESALAARIGELGQRKEFLTPGEHQELLSLVEFTEHRTIEKLEAKLALAEIDRACPAGVSPT